MDWRYRLGASGLWRLVPGANYWWPAPMNVFLYWHVPALPLPSFTLRRYERQLWERARPAPEGGLEPDAAALFVYLAVQVSRPGSTYHAEEWRHLLHCLPFVDHWPRVFEIAEAAGFAPAVRNAVEAARERAPSPDPTAVMSGAPAAAWRVASALQRRARPRSLRALWAGHLHLGDAPVRCRMKGIDVMTRSGVFVPTPDADLLVELAVDRIRTVAAPKVVEVGTGSGAIALAIANARPTAVVYGTDTSPAAVRWAKRNRRRLAATQVRFRRGPLLSPIPRELRGTVSLIVADLPFYPSDRFAAIGAVPRDTIQGPGCDGLDLLRDLARDARTLLAPDGALILQMFDWQWERLKPELADLGYRPGEARRSGPFALCPSEFNPQGALCA
jgi:methylase of polypeptide subunit release factors